MKAIQIVHVVGARPNFMKAAPVIKETTNISHFEVKLVHTGQHYDKAMSTFFFDELGLPQPQVNLEVGSGSHAEQTGTIMMRFEKVLQKDPPALVVVYGDVNSTIACSLVCAKLGESPNVFRMVEAWAFCRYCIRVSTIVLPTKNTFSEARPSANKCLLALSSVVNKKLAN